MFKFYSVKIELLVLLTFSLIIPSLLSATPVTDSLKKRLILSHLQMHSNLDQYQPGFYSFGKLTTEELKEIGVKIKKYPLLEQVYYGAAGFNTEDLVNYEGLTRIIQVCENIDLALEIPDLVNLFSQEDIKVITTEENIFKKIIFAEPLLSLQNLYQQVNSFKDKALEIGLINQEQYNQLSQYRYIFDNAFEAKLVLGKVKTISSFQNILKEAIRNKIISEQEQKFLNEQTKLSTKAILGNILIRRVENEIDKQQYLRLAQAIDSNYSIEQPDQAHNQFISLRQARYNINTKEFLPKKIKATFADPQITTSEFAGVDFISEDYLVFRVLKDDISEIEARKILSEHNSFNHYQSFKEDFTHRASATSAYENGIIDIIQVAKILDAGIEEDLILEINKKTQIKLYIEQALEVEKGLDLDILSTETENIIKNLVNVCEPEKIKKLFSQIIPKNLYLKSLERFESPEYIQTRGIECASDSIIAINNLLAWIGLQRNRIKNGKLTELETEFLAELKKQTSPLSKLELLENYSQRAQVQARK